jgi:beta-glucanase (GH16 family)
VPSISSLSPSSATAGAAAQTLTINGANFMSSSTVTYNGVGHTATFVSSTQLTIPLSASDQATAGSYAVVVTNPSPGGGPSNSVDFNVALAMPVFSTTAAQNGAAILALSSTTSGAGVHYTIDGSTPTASSPTYQTPMLISSNLTINAIATAPGLGSSSVATWSPPTTVPPGALVWSDEFTNTTGANVQPNPAVWTYDTGGGGWGNSELEDYCGWDSSASPCNPTNPNVYVGTDGYLHIVAEEPSSGVYTSARMKSQGLFSILYGRVEARIMVPEAQGLWPAFWMMGNNIVTDGWPACGEADIQERINAATNPDWNAGSIHGIGFTGQYLGTTYYFPSGQTAAGWHTYGMIWQPGSVQYYIDGPANIYATYTPASLNSLKGAVWPFDSGNAQFFIVNLAVGGSWPGSPNSTTPFPSETLVDYVRVYSYGSPAQATAAPASKEKGSHDEVTDPGRDALTRPAPADEDAIAGHPLLQGGEGWVFTQTLRARQS